MGLFFSALSRCVSLAAVNEVLSELMHHTEPNLGAPASDQLFGFVAALFA